MIYFIQCKSDNLIKIGYTSNPKDRIYALKNEHGDLKLLGWIPGNYKHESDLHDNFSFWNVEGEWFKPVEPLIAWIENHSCKIPIEEIEQIFFPLMN